VTSLSFGRGHLSSQITKLNSIPKTDKYNIDSIKIRFGILNTTYPHTTKSTYACHSIVTICDEFYIELVYEKRAK
jgi:hypothetical protein